MKMSKHVKNVKVKYVKIRQNIFKMSQVCPKCPENLKICQKIPDTTE